MKRRIKGSESVTDLEALEQIAANHGCKCMCGMGSDCPQNQAVLAALREAVAWQREKLAKWMIANSFATGHGDSFDDLLRELSWQVKEFRAIRASGGGE